MRIKKINPTSKYVLNITAEDGRRGVFDVTPYLQDEAFTPLTNQQEFMKVSNGSYFIEWECGADLSADTIEAHWIAI